MLSERKQSRVERSLSPLMVLGLGSLPASQAILLHSCSATQVPSTTVGSPLVRMVLVLVMLDRLGYRHCEYVAIAQMVQDQSHLKHDFQQTF